MNFEDVPWKYDRPAMAYIREHGGPLPDFIVIRPGESLLDGFLSPELDGKWFDRSRVPVVTEDVAEAGRRRFRENGGTVSVAVAVPTGRFEVRDDGAVAEVWEMRL